MLNPEPLSPVEHTFSKLAIEMSEDLCKKVEKMIIANEQSIKEVIAFPKNTAALSPMDDSPSYVEQKQLEMRPAS